MKKYIFLLAACLMSSISEAEVDDATCPPAAEPGKRVIVRPRPFPQPSIITVECKPSNINNPPQASSEPIVVTESPPRARNDRGATPMERIHEIKGDMETAPHDWIDRGLTFLERILAILAWPAVLLTLLVKFRAEIQNLLERVAHLKFKDFELDFQRLKEQVEKVQAEEPQLSRTRKNGHLASFEDQLLTVVESSPSAAVLLAWTGIETSLSSAVARLVISQDTPSYRSPLHNIEALKNSSRISRDQESLLNGMRILRNKLAHDASVTSLISEDQALSYVVAALELIQSLELLRHDG